MSQIAYAYLNVNRIFLRVKRLTHADCADYLSGRNQIAW